MKSRTPLACDPAVAVSTICAAAGLIRARCAQGLLAHPLITLREHCGPVQLRQLPNDAWQASNTDR